MAHTPSTQLPRTMMDRLHDALMLLLATVSVLVICLAGLIGSRTGTRLLITTINLISDTHIEAQHIHGRLVGPLRVDQLRIVSPRFQMLIDHADIDWSPWHLFQKQLVIKQWRMHGLHWTEAFEQRAHHPIHNQASTENLLTSNRDTPVLLPGWSLVAKDVQWEQCFWQRRDASVYAFDHFDLTANTQGNTQHLAMTAKVDAGRMTLQARFPLDHASLSAVDFKTEHLNLGIINGNLHSDLNMAFHLQQDGKQTEMLLRDVSGTLNHQPIAAEANWQLTHQGDFQGHIAWHNGPQHLRIDADGKHHLRWEADISQLHDLWPFLGGALQSKGNIQLQMDHTPYPQWQGAFSVSSKGLEINRQHLAEQLELKASTQADKHHYAITHEIDAIHWQTTITERTQGTQTQGTMDTLSLHIAGTDTRWTLEHPLHWSIQPDAYHIKPFCLHGGGTQRICGNLAWHTTGDIDGHLTMDHIALNQLKAWLPLGTDIPSELTFTSGIQGDNGTVGMVTAQAKVSEGEWTLVNEATQHHIPIQSMQAQLIYKDHDIQSKGHIDFKSQPALKWQLHLPDVDWPMTATQKMSAHIDWDNQQLGMLPIPHLNFTQGALHWHQKIYGSIQSPDIRGSLRLEDAAVHVAPLHVDWQNMQFVLQGDGDDVEVTMRLEGQDQKAYLAAEGKLDWEHNHLLGDLTIRGQDFPIVQNHEYRIWVTPDLRWHVQPHQNHVTGTLTIPKAQITPRDFSNTETLSKDVVLVDHATKHQPHSYWPYLNVSLILEKNIVILTHGLQGLLEGALQIENSDKNPTPSATGLLRLLDGTYTIYGQKMGIERGNLSYNHNGLGDPNLDIRATRKIEDTGLANSIPTTMSNNPNSPNNSLNATGNMTTMSNLYQDITVGLDITGSVNAPNTTLFSIPGGLDDNDILSYLILGRSTGADQSDSNMLMGAISQLGIESSDDQLSEKVKRHSHLDVSFVTTTTTDTDDQVSQNTAIAIGKYLTPHLYVSYSVGLIEPVNTFKAVYTINKNWSLQSVSSLIGNGFDLIYSF